MREAWRCGRQRRIRRHRCTRLFNPSSSHARSLLFPHSFSISFSSSLRNDGSNSPLFPPSPSLSHPLPHFFFYYHTLPLTTCSLRWEAIRLTSFSLAILLFSPPRLRFFFLLLISISVLVSSRCAVMDVTCGVRGEGGMFFNLPPLPKTIQLASHCLNNSRIALVKVLFMIEVKCTWD